MRNLTVVMALALAALCTASTASAQMMGRQSNIPTPKGIFNPVVGSGAQYEIDRPDGQKNAFSIAIVGKDSAEGKDAYWMETSITDPRMGEIVMKMLLVVDGNASHASRMIMQMGTNTPMEMPMQMMGRGPMAQQQPADIRSQADDLGSETVTVPAGTFTAEHYRGKTDGGDVWVSKDAPPYGMIKAVDKDKSTIVLVKAETNVQDRITGTPQPFNPMAFGRGPQGGAPLNQ